MIDYSVKMTSSHLMRMEIVKDEPETSHRRTTVPESYRTGDSFAGRRVVTMGGGSGTFSVLSHLKKDQFALISKMAQVFVVRPILIRAETTISTISHL